MVIASVLSTSRDIPFFIVKVDIIFYAMIFRFVGWGRIAIVLRIIK